MAVPVKTIKRIMADPRPAPSPSRRLPLICETPGRCKRQSPRCGRRVKTGEGEAHDAEEGVAEGVVERRKEGQGDDELEEGHDADEGQAEDLVRDDPLEPVQHPRRQSRPLPFFLVLLCLRVCGGVRRGGSVRGERRSTVPVRSGVGRSDALQRGRRSGVVVVGGGGCAVSGGRGGRSEGVDVEFVVEHSHGCATKGENDTL